MEVSEFLRLQADRIDHIDKVVNKDDAIKAIKHIIKSLTLFLEKEEESNEETKLWKL